MRMHQLDALRAFAIGLVMAEHFLGQTFRDYFPIGAGSLGVGCFFTLSGFLITGILLASFDARPEDRPAVWRGFYAKRLLRLLPAYYAVLLALVLLGVAPIAASWPWHAAYLTNVWIALGNPSNVFWSLAVEEQFYLFWPFVIAFSPRRWLPAVTIALIGLSLAFKAGIVLLGFSTGATHALLPSNFELLAVGCLLAVVSYRGGEANQFAWYQGPPARAFDVVAWLAIIVAIASWAILGNQSLVRYFTNNLLCAIFFAWLVLRAARGFDGLAGKVFGNRAVQYVGEISYGLYLVHNWMPGIVERFFGPLPRLEAGAIVLTLTFGICVLSWHFFERPILSLRRYVEGRKASPPLPQSPPASGSSVAPLPW